MYSYEISVSSSEYNFHQTRSDILNIIVISYNLMILLFHINLQNYFTTPQSFIQSDKNDFVLTYSKKKQQEKKKSQTKTLK